MTQISPTSFKLFHQCRAAWWFRYVRRIKEIDKGHFALGTAVHTAVEQWLDGGWSAVTEDTPLASEAAARLRAAWRAGTLDQLLPPGSEPFNYAVEQTVSLDLEPHGGVGELRGKADILWLGDRPTVIDHKSTKNPEFWLDPEQLSQDSQLVAYAAAAFPTAPVVRVAHHYLPPAPIEPAIVWAEVDRQTMDAVVADFAATSVAQAAVREATNVLEVGPPEDDSACFAYGGCGFGLVCPFAPARLKDRLEQLDQIARLDQPAEHPFTNRQEITVSFADRLARARASAPAPEPTPPLDAPPPDAPEPAPAAAPVQRINPPDAAPPYSAEDPAPNPAADAAEFLFNELIGWEADTIVEQEAKTLYKERANVPRLSAALWAQIVAVGEQRGFWEPTVAPHKKGTTTALRILSEDERVAAKPAAAPAPAPAAEPAPAAAEPAPAAEPARELTEPWMGQPVVLTYDAGAAATTLRSIHEQLDARTAPRAVNKPLVLVDCVVMGAETVDFGAWLAPYTAAATKDRNGVDHKHWLAVPFNQGPALVAAAVELDIRAGEFELPRALHVDSRHPCASLLLPVLGEFAWVVRSTR